VGPRAGPNILQKKNTLTPTGIPTELSRLLKEKKFIKKTVIVKSARMSQTRVQYYNGS